MTTNYRPSIAQDIEYGYMMLFNEWCQEALNVVMNDSMIGSKAFYASGHDNTIDCYLVFFANHDGSAYVAPSYF